MMTKASIQLPKKLKQVFSAKRGSVRNRAIYGGRGSGKSYNAALMAAVFGYSERLRILCTRDLQNSIRESFHAELKSAIESTEFLQNNYKVGVDFLRCKNGTEFIFSGLRHNISSIKSMAKVDICIIEEAEDVHESSWIDLEPTIRKNGSEIWALWNPKTKGSPVDKRFRLQKPPDSIICEMNWRDNPRFPEPLQKLRKYQEEILSPELYAHVWEGAYYSVTDAQIFAGRYEVREFTVTEEYGLAYIGLDFGFSNHPTAATKSYIFGDCLYIDAEAGGYNLELERTATVILEAIPEARNHSVVADCARPESISFLKNHGMPYTVGSKKGAGSVEDGITFLLNFRRIIIHPRCKKVAEEFLLYSYKIDQKSGNITTQIVKEHDHYIDSLRYALEPVMRRKNIMLEVF